MSAEPFPLTPSPFPDLCKKSIVVRQQGLSDVESQIWHKAIALAVYKSDRSSPSAIFQLPMPI
ncbi:hypothetical protein A4S05_30855 [Nostoc sp. KVJ20]|uniref:hypothetical protein n=1 Tax=unclassified Nostoc TaxID=2593658 RepID=UPI00083DF88E|nr:hypothetical protein [Nostoc sp. KVJ20]ODH01047.1 hypothetical protein A4S05_30855 [Nostoc sp. KVJ20]